MYPPTYTTIMYCYIAILYYADRFCTLHCTISYSITNMYVVHNIHVFLFKMFMNCMCFIWTNISFCFDAFVVPRNNVFWSSSEWDVKWCKCQRWGTWDRICFSNLRYCCELVVLDMTKELDYILCPPQKKSASNQKPKLGMYTLW